MVLAMATETVARAATDIDLTETVAGVLAVPRSEPPDSFILHAPLELLARAALLPHVSPDLRAAARDRIEAIAPQFEGFADAAAIPAFEGTTHAAERCLRDALRDGDLEAEAQPDGDGHAARADEPRRACRRRREKACGGARRREKKVGPMGRGAPGTPSASARVIAVANASGPMPSISACREKV